MYHATRARWSECPLNASCRCRNETLEHLLWTCNRARQTRRLLLARWTLTRSAEGELDELLEAALPNIAARKAPPMHATFGFVTEDHVAAMDWIWRTLTTVSTTTLWTYRNDTVRNVAKHSPREVEGWAWRAGVRKVKAISAHKSSRRDT